MYTVNSETNRITPVPSQSFSALKLSERAHLQEWLAHTPSALGEELLVIQKEFDGFDDTRERLDLLALDKEGNLVIIENKLDDSGRDVVWQALKYASYCASLSKQQVVDVYQQYLNRHAPGDGADAATRLCDFLDAPDLDEVKLNLGNSQRIVLVAAHFRKEVTSTALWLLGQGISVQCFRVTPWSLGEQLLINVDQIIPTPEAGELMIGIKAKAAEEKSADVVQKKRHSVRRAYWEQLLAVFQASDCTLYDNISASKDHWLSAGCGLSGCHYSLIFGQKMLRVSLTLGRAEATDNKFLFDAVEAEKAEVEVAFGEPLRWLRLDDKKSSRIEYELSADSTDESRWSDWIDWHLTHIVRFDGALRGALQRAGEALKRQGGG